MNAVDPTTRTLLDMLHEGAYLLDAEQVITYWNPAAELLTGYPAGQMVGNRCSDARLMHVDASGRLLCHDGCPVAATLANGESRNADVYLQHREGHRIPVGVRTAALRNDQGRVVGAIETFIDLSPPDEFLKEIASLRQMAYLDPLCGIANRRYVEAAIEARLRELSRFGWSFGVMAMDIDRFKDVNDRFGHQMGDAVLRAVSSTIRNALRSFDLVGRWGGDELVAVVANADHSILKATAERITALVRMSGPQRVAATLSIGAALAREGDTAASLVPRADRLMYHSKR